jgi:hypothetical protein
MPDHQAGVTVHVPQGEFLLCPERSLARYLFTQRGRDYYRVQKVGKSVKSRVKRRRFDERGNRHVQ